MMGKAVTVQLIFEGPQRPSERAINELAYIFEQPIGLAELRRTSNDGMQGYTSRLDLMDDSDDLTIVHKWIDRSGMTLIKSNPRGDGTRIEMTLRHAHQTNGQA